MDRLLWSGTRGVSGRWANTPLLVPPLLTCLFFDIATATIAVARAGVAGKEVVFTRT